MLEGAPAPAVFRQPDPPEGRSHADDRRPGPHSAAQRCSLEPQTHSRDRSAETAGRPRASLDSIAQAVDVARRTVYGHFSSREALVAELTQEADQALRQAFATAGTPVPIRSGR
ncbi:helix-turn-helix domain-containing protein [Streptomyces sp. NPDC047082]|uniref:TetR/AcrR family transcriptional regulator n=1 Tax=Streptomyces sp. NPDC047082 TaxID=3155259 RepID=UPI003405AD28